MGEGGSAMTSQPKHRPRKGPAPVSAKRKPVTGKGSQVRAKKPTAVKLTVPAGKADVSLVRLKGGLTRKLFARITGFSERAIAGWESGEPLSDAARRRLLETERFRERLAQVVKPEAIAEWLDTPNDAFGSLKPVEVIERGEIDRLWSMIFYLESGVAS